MRAVLGGMASCSEQTGVVYTPRSVEYHFLYIAWWLSNPRIPVAAVFPILVDVIGRRHFLGSADARTNASDSLRTHDASVSRDGRYGCSLHSNDGSSSFCCLLSTKDANKVLLEIRDVSEHRFASARLVTRFKRRQDAFVLFQRPVQSLLVCRQLVEAAM